MKSGNRQMSTLPEEDTIIPQFEPVVLGEVGGRAPPPPVPVPPSQPEFEPNADGEPVIGDAGFGDRPPHLKEPKQGSRGSGEEGVQGNSGWSSSSGGHYLSGLEPRHVSMGSDEDPKEYDRLQQTFRKILILGNVIGGGMLVMIFIWGVLYGGGYSWSTPFGAINIHISIMAVFMIYIQGHASLIYRILPAKPKYTVKLIHAGLHAAVCIAIGVGLTAAVHSHNLKKSPHFYSLHSWLGITTIGFYYLQFLIGFVTFLVPVTPMGFRNMILPVHRFLGQSVFTFATGAAVTGVMLKAIASLQEKYQEMVPAGLLLNTGGFLALLFALIVGNLVTDFRFRRRARPEGELLLSQADGRGDGDADQSDQTD